MYMYTSRTQQNMLLELKLSEALGNTAFFVVEKLQLLKKNYGTTGRANMLLEIATLKRVMRQSQRLCLKVATTSEGGNGCCLPWQGILVGDVNYCHICRLHMAVVLERAPYGILGGVISNPGGKCTMSFLFLSGWDVLLLDSLCTAVVLAPIMSTSTRYPLLVAIFSIQARVVFRGVIARVRLQY